MKVGWCTSILLVLLPGGILVSSIGRLGRLHRLLAPPAATAAGAAAPFDAADYVAAGPPSWPAAAVGSSGASFNASFGASFGVTVSSLSRAALDSAAFYEIPNLRSVLLPSAWRWLQARHPPEQQQTIHPSICTLLSAYRHRPTGAHRITSLAQLLARPRSGWSFCVYNLLPASLLSHFSVANSNPVPPRPLQARLPAPDCSRGLKSRQRLERVC